MGGLTHQLYDSLRSDFSVEGARYSISGSGIDDSGSSYGAGIEEDYKKNLGDWGKLKLSYATNRKQERRYSSTATTRTIRESVALSDGQTVLLGSAGIDLATVEVEDVSGTRLYTSGLDYILIQRGDFTEIKRVFAGRIPDGSTVRVSYLAAADSDVDVNTVQDRSRAEIQLIDAHLTIFAEYMQSRNTGERSLSFQDLSDKRIGMSYGWEWLELGISRQDFEADSFGYRNLTTYQKVNYSPVSGGALIIEGTQSTTRHDDRQYDQKIDTYIVRYSQSLSSRLTVTGMAGLRQEEFDYALRDADIAEMDIDYRIGRLKVYLSHILENEETDTEIREKRATMIKLERDFW
jgi:hypothetical protein